MDEVGRHEADLVEDKSPENATQKKLKQGK